jgi:L-alanine-DL-glutamate epimerase-like enolase superfamily enzyme
LDFRTTRSEIVRVEADVHSVPFGGVAVTQGVGNMVKRDLVLMRVTNDDGIVGYGEAPSHQLETPSAIA